MLSASNRSHKIGASAAIALATARYRHQFSRRYAALHELGNSLHVIIDKQFHFLASFGFGPICARIPFNPAITEDVLYRAMAIGGGPHAVEQVLIEDAQRDRVMARCIEEAEDTVAGCKTKAKH